MLFVPYGHDRYVHHRPVITAALIAANVLCFFFSLLSARHSAAAIDRTVVILDQTHREYPEARVPAAMLAGLPASVRKELHPLELPEGADEDAYGVLELKDSVRALTNAFDSIPVIRYGYRPAHPRVATIFTSLFMHADIWHLLGNMLLLWITAGVIESFWGRLPFVLLYFAAGAAGTLCHHLFNQGSETALVGASGAIAGLMAAFVVGHPNARIKVFYAVWFVRPMVGVNKVPAWAVILLWVALQLFFAVISAGDGVAYWAHVGGFAAGLAATAIMRLGGWITYDADEVLRARAR